MAIFQTDKPSFKFIFDIKPTVMKEIIYWCWNGSSSVQKPVPVRLLTAVSDIMF